MLKMAARWDTNIYDNNSNNEHVYILLYNVSCYNNEYIHTFATIKM